MILHADGDSLQIFDDDGMIITSIDMTGYGGIDNYGVSGSGFWVRTREGVTMIFDDQCRLKNSIS